MTGAGVRLADCGVARRAVRVGDAAGCVLNLALSQAAASAASDVVRAVEEGLDLGAVELCVVACVPASRDGWGPGVGGRGQDMGGRPG